eukprot:10120805-Alexandrium_andersonii.AAC.1
MHAQLTTTAHGTSEQAKQQSNLSSESHAIDKPPGILPLGRGERWSGLQDANSRHRHGTPMRKKVCTRMHTHQEMQVLAMSTPPGIVPVGRGGRWSGHHDNRSWDVGAKQCITDASGGISRIGGPRTTGRIPRRMERKLQAEGADPDRSPRTPC